MIKVRRMRFTWLKYGWILLLLAALIAPSASTFAQGGDAGVLIAAVNALRESQGLQPYKVDAELIAYAQSHSEYQAAIKKSTHLHKDGSTPQQFGILENVASGGLGAMTAEIAVYQVWADAVHGRTMTGYATGFIGAGAASDGTNVYYTLNVRPGDAATAIPNRTGATQAPIAPVHTSTPRSDGAVYHKVAFGQSLWSIAIAYGVKIDEIKRWNNLPAESNDIIIGQMLLIRMGRLQTPTSNPLDLPTATQHPELAQIALQVTETPTRTATVTVTATATQKPELPDAGLAPPADLNVAEQENATAMVQKARSPLAFLPFAAGFLILIGFVLLAWGYYLQKKV